MSLEIIAVCICEKREAYSGEFQRCKQCKNTRYCSLACYKKDWNNGHKQTCQKLISDPKSIKALNLLNTKKGEVPLHTIIQLQARKYYIENNKLKNSNETFESQQVVLCEMAEITYDCTFCIINQQGIDNPPDFILKRHLDACKDKFLLFIHDLNSKMISTYESEKIEI
jgi:hypothetical protein